MLTYLGTAKKVGGLKILDAKRVIFQTPRKEGFAGGREGVTHYFTFIKVLLNSQNSCFFALGVFFKGKYTHVTKSIIA